MRKPSLRAADPAGIERHGRAGNCAGGARRSGLGDEQLPRCTDRGQRCALGDAMATRHGKHLW